MIRANHHKLIYPFFLWLSRFIGGIDVKSSSYLQELISPKDARSLIVILSTTFKIATDNSFQNFKDAQFCWREQPFSFLSRHGIGARSPSVSRKIMPIVISLAFFASS